ncbi:MAG: exopolysaccharide biosynthesis polyprenyl glycosylphosphotransferase [Candidatus Falkowbacteria bacterium]|nr:exopolysaccharide biosynthesis polyprenyl glycosylphosphotransferase [Candidatus Falkowbacteria bacterium]
MLLAKPHLGYNISFIVDTENKPKDFINNSSIANIPIINNIDSINENLINQDISEIIIASDIRESEAIKDTLYNCLKLNINLVNITRFYENISGKIHLDLVNKMWILENFNKMNYQWFDLFKRIYDIAASLFMLLITLPIWPIVALLVKLDSAGPIFFTQKRLGKNETVFTMIKFRTMRAVDNNQTPTTIGDTRISKLGSFLRKTRIDELPQVLNVLKGDMSIVGPRPERPEIAVGLKNEIPFYAIRMLVKPGITGWDQVSGEYHSPSQNDTLKKLQYDFYYIKNRSLYLELSILLKTIATVLSRNGI